MTVRLLPVFVVVALAGMTGSLSAHHSTVAYASQSIVLKKATMTNIVWANPHIILTFSVKETNGTASTWSAESGSPGSVARIGWNRNSVKVGDVVTIELFPAKNGAHVGRLKKVTFSDGHELLDTQNPETLKP
jgi:Family of unknown function (DUF6152)